MRKYNVKVTLTLWETGEIFEVDYSTNEFEEFEDLAKKLVKRVNAKRRSCKKKFTIPKEEETEDA